MFRDLSCIIIFFMCIRKRMSNCQIKDEKRRSTWNLLHDSMCRNERRGPFSISIFPLAEFTHKHYPEDTVEINAPLVCMTPSFCVTPHVYNAFIPRIMFCLRLTHKQLKLYTNKKNLTKTNSFIALCPFSFCTALPSVGK